jgi:ABC-type transport system substrate-binding protein
MNIPKRSVILLVVLALLLAACTTPAAQSPQVAEVSEVAEATQATEQAAAVAGTTLDPAANLPLKDALESLEPRDVFQNFYNITQIPRPSGHMERIREFLVAFGEGLGLEPLVDEAATC